MDPTLQMVHTCGYLAGLDIDVHLKVRGGSQECICVLYIVSVCF
jgi:hypothetical protein